MKFLHINKLEDNDSQMRELNTSIDSGNHVFLLIYMEGCGPCNETRPEWKKIENILSIKTNNYKKKYKNILVADLNSDFSDKLSKKVKQPSAFPTMIYISQKGNNVEKYEDSNIQNKERTIDSFIEWIDSKLKDNKYKESKTPKYGGKKGGKWSRKYKRSINCRRPRGFSQKQYCKYGRNKSKK
jgi:hypothetical protein